MRGTEFDRHSGIPANRAQRGTAIEDATATTLHPERRRPSSRAMPGHAAEGRVFHADVQRSRMRDEGDVAHMICIQRLSVCVSRYVPRDREDLPATGPHVGTRSTCATPLPVHLSFACRPYCRQIVGATRSDRTSDNISRVSNVTARADCGERGGVTRGAGGLARTRRASPPAPGRAGRRRDARSAHATTASFPSSRLSRGNVALRYCTLRILESAAHTLRISHYLQAGHKNTKQARRGHNQDTALNKTMPWNTGLCPPPLALPCPLPCQAPLLPPPLPFSPSSLGTLNSAGAMKWLASSCTIIMQPPSRRPCAETPRPAVGPSAEKGR